jgi:hypothetical protein
VHNLGSNGRLVLLGAPGAGKTGAMILLLLAAEGAVTPNPRTLGPLLWLFVDSTPYLRFSRRRTLIVCDLESYRLTKDVHWLTRVATILVSG